MVKDQNSEHDMLRHDDRLAMKITKVPEEEELI